MEKNKVYVQLQTISRSIPLNTSDEKQHIDNMTWELTQKELRILEWVGTDSGELKKKKKTLAKILQVPSSLSIAVLDCTKGKWNPCSKHEVLLFCVLNENLFYKPKLHPNHTDSFSIYKCMLQVFKSLFLH